MSSTGKTGVPNTTAKRGPFTAETAVPQPGASVWQVSACPAPCFALEMLQNKNGRTQYTVYSIPDASSWIGGRVALVKVRFN